MELSVCIAVQSLAASWNQTLSNATSHWSGEFGRVSPFRCVKPIPPVLLQQSRVVVEYPTREISLIWTQIIKTNIKEENNARNRLGVVPQGTAFVSANRNTGVIIKARVHKQLIQPHSLLPSSLEHCLNFTMAICSPKSCQECMPVSVWHFCLQHCRLGNLLRHLHRWHRHLLAQEQRRADGVTALSGDVLRRQIQHHQWVHASVSSTASKSRHNRLKTRLNLIHTHTHTHLLCFPWGKSCIRNCVRRN